MQNQEHAPLTLLEWKLLRWMAGDHGSDVVPTFIIHRGLPHFFGQDFTVETARAALSLISRGWTERRGALHAHYRLNADGQHAAATIAEPAWSPPPAPALTVGDISVLRALADMSGSERRWVPGPHPSVRLLRLVQSGLVECRARDGGEILSVADVCPPPSLSRPPRVARVYRVTERGLSRQNQEIRNAVG